MFCTHTVEWVSVNRKPRTNQQVILHAKVQLKTMPELRVQPSFTYNDEDSNSPGPAARFVMEPTEINDSFAAKFQCSLFTASVFPYHRSLRCAGTTGWRKGHLPFHTYNIKCQVTSAPPYILRSYYILQLNSRHVSSCDVNACSWDVRGDLTLNSMVQIHTSVTLLTSRDLTWSSGRLTC
jgi:hypothetical protein